MPKSGRQQRGVRECFKCGLKLIQVTQQASIPCDECMEQEDREAGVAA